ncbi:MAG: hypothetical protein ACREVJ_01535 [Gammaproteobacteria bacterium]
MEKLIALGSGVVLAGSIGLLQAHGIAFWSETLGPYGIAWSLLLEATALWLWTKPGSGSRVLACVASGLLLLGPLYQVGTPVLEGLALAQHSDQARAKEIPLVEAEIRQLTGQLAAFTENSGKRSGWLPAIEGTQARLIAARGKLAALYREAPRSSGRIEAQERVVIAMECIGLLLFQVTAVLAITALAKSARDRKAFDPGGVLLPQAEQVAGAPRPADNVVPLPPAQDPSAEAPKRRKPKPRRARPALGRALEFSSLEQRRRDG